MRRRSRPRLRNVGWGGAAGAAGAGAPAGGGGGGRGGPGPRRDGGLDLGGLDLGGGPPLGLLRSSRAPARRSWQQALHMETAPSVGASEGEYSGAPETS